MMELQVHLHERLLHVLDVRRRVLDQALAMAKVRAQRDDLLMWPEAAAK